MGGATQDLVERQDQDLAVGRSQDPVAREALALALALALDLVLALATMIMIMIITMMISGRTGTGIGLTLSHLSQQLSPLIFTIVIRTTLLVHATKLVSVWSTNNASESIVPLTIPQKSSSMTMRVTHLSPPKCLCHIQLLLLRCYQLRHPLPALQHLRDGLLLLQSV